MVNGIIGSDGVAVFEAIVCTLLAQQVSVRLSCRELAFLGAVGTTVSARAIRNLPHRKVVLEGANETVRSAWELSGFATPDSPVVMTP
ncbi:hypothetical protein [Actinacidiphila bryophytorum]|uniref:STAS domain-containing protein n=1 Tax=Actinacidiphila bryophytorum TaxID=1436133 RepID=A0A9W4H6M9_9ACTN|nr:hypothetical protein [Actinacidiphila bryophytorum]MBM9436826.1 hypothetical protein [Actinacidiphila bryophytorum]MBN6542331.1 hypothetical protein [Actinacidiphila bryophytorum]CAG7654469.1 hypothetical protein SBRY_60485 [Actinacidiphila bryophytorum]